MIYEDVKLLPRQQFDRNGDPIGEKPTPVVLKRCVVWPRGATGGGNDETGDDLFIDGENVSAPDNPVTRAISSGDRVEIRGDVYEIDGPPGVYTRKAVMFKTRRVRS